MAQERVTDEKGVVGPDGSLFLKRHPVRYETVTGHINHVRVFDYQGGIRLASTRWSQKLTRIGRIMYKLGRIRLGKKYSGLEYELSYVFNSDRPAGKIDIKTAKIQFNMKTRE